MNKAVNKSSSRKKVLGSLPLCLGAILVGVSLIFSSLLTRGNLAPTSQWTDKDAKKFAVISEQYHRSAGQVPRETGLTPKQMDIQNEKLKKSFDAMHKKLERARSQPQRWSQYLLWSGALLTAVGGLSHMAAQKSS